MIGHEKSTQSRKDLGIISVLIHTIHIIFYEVLL